MTVIGGRRAGLVFSQWRWVLIGVAAITAFILGIIGLGEKHLAPDDRIYGSLQLFRFSTPLTPPYPTDLEIARFLALASIAYAAFRGISAIFREQWARFWVANFLHDHVVVCGLGYSGMRLAKSFRKTPNGTKVVVIDVNPSIADVEECRDLGIYCMSGDATDSGFLKQTGIGRARSVVVTCGDDDVNAQVALLAQNAPSERHSKMSCYVNIGEDELCRLLEQSAMSSHGRIRFEFFNVYRSGPRASSTCTGTGETPRHEKHRIPSWSSATAAWWPRWFRSKVAAGRSSAAMKLTGFRSSLSPLPPDRRVWHCAHAIPVSTTCATW